MNWSAKVEYQYYDFGTDTVTFVDVLHPAVASFPYDIDQRVHSVKVGLNYRFNWGAPGVARY